MTPSITVDTRGLSDAISERLKYQDRTNAEILNTSAYYAAGRAKSMTPFTDQENIDISLGKYVTPKITKSGKIIRKHKFGQGESRTPGVPLVALIIQSRIGKGGRWGLAQSPFKGVSRRQGAALMQRMAMKLLKARHSSTHFIQSGWIGAVKQLKKFAIRRGTDPSIGDNDKDYDFDDRSGGTVRADLGQNFAIIENATGDQGEHAPRVQEAIQRYGAMSALQQAVDEEERGMRAWMERHNKPLDDAMNKKMR